MPAHAAQGYRGRHAERGVRLRRHARRRPWRRRDRGSTTIEMVVLATAMFASLVFAVQIAAWGLAELTCRYTANHAVQATRVAGGTVADGEADAAAVLAQSGGRHVAEVRVTVERDDTTASVAITGHAARILPILRIPVGARVSAPVEILDPSQPETP